MLRTTIVISTTVDTHRVNQRPDRFRPPVAKTTVFGQSVFVQSIATDLPRSTALPREAPPAWASAHRTSTTQWTDFIQVWDARTMASPECSICQKHRGEGPLIGPVIHQDALVIVSHRAVGSLGYAFVETRRHVSSLADLTDAEAEKIGRMTTRLARGLRSELDVEHVHSMVAGLGVAHFHQHVFVRHVGTPTSYGWCEIWSEAPEGDSAHLADRLSTYLH